MDPLAHAFAQNLRLLREKKKITQGTLAKLAGVSVSYISMLERGTRTPPLPQVTAFARALKVSPLAMLQAPTRQKR